jgi:osmotically-inducible protein OsmY
VEDEAMRTFAPQLFSVAVCLAIAAGCGRGPDTRGNVEKALSQANIERVQVEVDDDANVVHLKGSVKSMADRTRAEEVAAAAVGTSGRVLNELTVEGLNAETADDLDDQIEDALDRMLDNDPVLKARDVKFEVNNGMVTVKGEVRTAEEKNRVGELVRSAPGVKDMANALEIKSVQ